MKKLLLALVLICGVAHSQIALENVYPNGGAKKLGVVHLTSSGYKYFESDTDQIVLYNLNHSVFKTINIPQQADVNPFTWMIYYVSEELFNTNPNDVEYVISYGEWIGNTNRLKIYDENSNLLFSRDSFLLGGIVGDGVQKSGIVYTSNGVKMTLSRQGINGPVEVYSLPGVLPCNECTAGVITGLAQSESNAGIPQEFLPNPYPNPTNNYTTITYELPNEVKTGEIVFYNMVGQEVKRFTVSNSFTTLLISANDLAVGTYHYNLVTSKGTIPGKEIMVTK